MAPTVDVYKKTLTIVDHWNNQTDPVTSENRNANWFPEALFASRCMLTFNSAPPGDLRESMSTFNLKATIAKFTIETISRAPGAWAHVKVQTSYAEAAKPQQ